MRAKFHGSISEISPSAWDAIASTRSPFGKHAFLAALESSGSVGGESGWYPRYLTISDGNSILAASPLYVRTNSYGEYIFDWDWARAYLQHGVEYYPKLVAAIPFTPATTEKLMVAEGVDPGALIQATTDYLGCEPASSIHYLFLDTSEIGAFESPWLMRHSFQYHWANRGYRDFTDFLDALKSRKAKSIRREREAIASSGVHIRVIAGSDLTPEHGTLMHRLYLSTIEKMGAIPYLSPAFFPTVFSTMRKHIHLVLAEHERVTVAAALFYATGGALFGRYWGAEMEVPYLHFELCYYQGIELAIRNRLSIFEAGAQGEHKLSRGFLPALTYSAHYFQDSRFRAAIARYVDEEKRAIAGLLERLGPHSPYANLQH